MSIVAVRARRGSEVWYGEFFSQDEAFRVARELTALGWVIRHETLFATAGGGQASGGRNAAAGREEA